MNYWIYLLLFPIMAFGQTSQEITLDSVYYNLEKAQADLDEVCQVLGIQNNFVLTSSQETCEHGKRNYHGGRIINIVPEGMEKILKSAGNNPIAMKCVIAHEVYHHLNDDTVIINALHRLDHEKYADYGMGYYAYLAGYTQEEATLVFKGFTPADSFKFINGSVVVTHPPKSKRIENTLQGWNDAKKRIENGNHRQK